MINRLFVFTCLFIAGCSVKSHFAPNSQRDQHGNPIFNSVPLTEDTIGTYIISANYYTISNNIDNPNSSVFENDHPSLDEILEFARTRPSYFFMIHRNRIVSNMIMVNSSLDGKKSVYTLMILNPKSNQKVEIPCKTKGDLTELRAAEMELKKYDEKSIKLKLGPKGMFVFGKIAYSIQSFDELRAEVVKIVKDFSLDDPDSDLMIIRN